MNKVDMALEARHRKIEDRVWNAEHDFTRGLYNNLNQEQHIEPKCETTGRQKRKCKCLACRADEVFDAMEPEP